jgi:single-strand DNA-binding protein
MNRVVLLGRLGADPELRTMADGLAVLTMRLATNETYLDKNKERKEKTEWHNVVVFGARAEGLARFLTRGACILVEGGLRTSSYEKDGVKRYKTDVIAREVCLTGKAPSSEAAMSRGGLAPGVNGKIPPPELATEEIPF